MPALANTASIRPCRATMPSTSTSTAVSSVTSTRSTSTLPDAASSSCTRSRRSWFRSATTTCAPQSTSTVAIALPRPDPPRHQRHGSPHIEELLQRLACRAARRFASCRHPLTDILRTRRRCGTPAEPPSNRQPPRRPRWHSAHALNDAAARRTSTFVAADDARRQTDFNTFVNVQRSTSARCRGREWTGAQCGPAPHQTRPLDCLHGRQQSPMPSRRSSPPPDGRCLYPRRYGSGTWIT